MHPPPGRGKTAVPPCPLSRYSPAPALAGQDLADGEDRNVAGERIALGKAGLMAALLLAPTLAGAQPASNYQLPPASPSPAPRAAGPVEEGAPAPTVAAPPAATPTPKIVIPAPPAATPSPRTRATQAAAVPPRKAPTTPPPTGTPTGTATPESTATPAPPVASAPAPDAAPPPAAPPADAPPAIPDAQSTANSGNSLALWAGIAVAIGALLGALVFWRRRRTVTVPQIVAPAPRPEPPAPPSPPAPTPATPVARQPVAEPLELRLEATRMSATLVNTTLAYRLVAVNRGSQPLTDIAINGDMTAAHASKPMDEQLGLAGPDLPPIHHIDLLEPGAELALPGEMRLPLTAVTPIRAGEAALFVPLARFDAWASTPEGGAIHARAAYMVGQESAPSADRLQPFRLDLGPRTWADLGQRALALPVS